MTGRFGGGGRTSRSTQSSLFSGSSDSNNGDAANFECNICFDLAQDPIITLCGHLYCWPCLYKWLHIHSHSHECPVCKALIQEEKLVPLYGRGKNSTDPRSKSIPGVEIPHRPSGQRPETAPPPDRNAFPPQGVGAFGPFGLMGGFGPSVNTRFGNFRFSIGGLIPSIFNIQMLGFPGGTMYGHGAAGGYFYGAHGFPRELRRHQHGGFPPVSPFLLIGLLFLLFLII